MEHVTEGMYMAAAAGLFVLAVSFMLVAGECTDRMFAAEQAVDVNGSTLREVEAHE